MKKNTNSLFVGKNGELNYGKLGSHIKKKYKPDTPFDKSFVPYVIMLLCMVVDASVFINLFKQISYDNPLLIAVEVIGLLFAFDAVPVYAGVYLRRLKQNLTKDKFILWFAVVVCSLACLLNVVLRIMTIRITAAEASSEATEYFGNVAQTSTSSGPDLTAIALAVFATLLPIITSLGSFFISYATYDPLKFRKRQTEEMLIDKEDECRRLSAFYNEYELDRDFALNIVSDDDRKLEAERKRQRALVVSYYNYVKQKLKEHLANPTANNALSEDDCIDILNQLDQELAALERVETSIADYNSESKSSSFTSNSFVA